MSSNTSDTGFKTPVDRKIDVTNMPELEDSPDHMHGYHRPALNKNSSSDVPVTPVDKKINPLTIKAVQMCPDRPHLYRKDSTDPTTPLDHMIDATAMQDPDESPFYEFKCPPLQK